MWLPSFFFVDSNSPCKDLLCLHGRKVVQKLLCLVGAVLKSPFLKYSVFLKNLTDFSKT